jgi:hypothetical protein
MCLFSFAVSGVTTDDSQESEFNKGDLTISGLATSYVPCDDVSPKSTEAFSQILPLVSYHRPSLFEACFTSV